MENILKVYFACKNWNYHGEVYLVCPGWCTADLKMCVEVWKWSVHWGWRHVQGPNMCTGKMLAGTAAPLHLGESKKYGLSKAQIFTQITSHNHLASST